MTRAGLIAVMALATLGIGYPALTPMPIKLMWNASASAPIGLYSIDFDAPFGSDVMAVADGVVTWSGQRSGYGNVVEIDHGNGYMTRYAHNSAIVATPGDRVHSGQQIARVGSTGRSTGPHCHFEVWHDGRAVNPMVYVKSTRATRA